MEAADIPPRIRHLFNDSQAIPKTTRTYHPEIGWDEILGRPVPTWSLIEHLFDLGITSIEVVWRRRVQSVSILGLRSTRVLPRTTHALDRRTPGTHLKRPDGPIGNVQEDGDAPSQRSDDSV